MSPAETFALIDACSPFLKGLRESHAEFADRVMASDPDKELAALCDGLDLAAHAQSKDEAMRVLRQSKQKLALMVALYDLSGIWPLAKVTGALTRFADKAVSSALEFLWRQEQAKGTINAEAPPGKAYLVLAMGKMGAGELNYSSDIDLIVLDDSANAHLREDVEPSTFFVKLTRSLVSLLQDPTEDGYVFRTDLRLRPDPRATQVAIDIEAAANYYETQGQNWERAAMIKARACAGDPALGAEFLARMKPYIWRKYLDYAAIADVQSMKLQIHAVKGHGEIAIMGHNLKLGRGGIREIEFFAQTQQLIAGGRNPALRCIGTCDALDALADAKWITPQAARELKDAYAFLRMLEHRAQMVNDQQTHETPSDPAKFENYARFAGFENSEALAEKLRATLECVQGHYAALFESAGELSASEGNLVFTGGDDDPATLETLRLMGYAQVTEVAATIRAWHFGRYRATRTARAREILTEIMPQLLKALSEGGDADRAFFAFDKFLESLSTGVQLFSMLKANAPMLALIAQVLGSAPRLTEKISAQPRILEAVTAPDFFSALPDKETLAREINTLIPAGLSLEEAMDLSRIFAREKNFRVGVRILSETISAEEAGIGFSSVADVVLARLLGAVEQDIAAKHGAIKGGACVILGLGKLGGREMTAASDLDIMLIYDHAEDAETSDGPRSLAPGQYYAKITQGLMTALNANSAEGKLYDVDMRLRPSGSMGPIAVGRSAFEIYHHHEAWTWERMAMTRARAIAGDPTLAARVQNILNGALQAPRDAAQTKSDIADMRALMLKEHKSEGLWDLKRAKGGQVEIEFIAQWLELIHAGLLNSNTAAALTAARNANVLAAADSDALLSALQLFQRLTHVLRLCIDGSFNPKTAPAPLLKALSQAAGQPDISSTEAFVAETQDNVAALFKKLIGRPEEKSI
ncbi:bifunctional [glutamine synthetase] adenylyltransferase/[glutamine synthetase]-adenylyl-L-tyrosine phosphorylase [Aestuariivirga litoralis]|uniref:bifunctional [glutamine synthetase] adenylyltransferase/[glutamine synthetase]-adenylyl-L-tyrosine phosphorylase n=1 Tax=Aestuariivirga litoralis TaxID=2650924 RepID=UPI0018C5486C|nr:bifunctional [glutamine synthetase] adenylyltransferase/[glutamine synthetase]-adenylyl-L-tyrosine phosphorylase [Aestuariivirga litoralis]MBG1233443.1 bifunctional [glutamine synthetase] adenylyltransferase/[glutamine synthetase]-adenylyl-L-tyrosine phosphorylase [Aestuariivirga litoralis]